MEYHALDQHAEFSGATLVVPAVTIGCVGQLAADVLIASTEAEPVGYMDHPALLPCAGARGYEHCSDSLRSCSLEIYRSGGLVLLQQRAPAAPGCQKAFSVDLAKWASDNGIAKVVLLAGIDATYRRGAQIQDAQQLRLWRSGTAPRDNAASAPAIPELEASWWEDVPLDSRSSQPWAQLQACVESGLPVTALLRFVAEGDNRQDAVDLATAAGKLLELCSAAHQTWHPPAAWTWLFGGPAAALA